MEKTMRVFGLVVIGAFLWLLASTGEAANTWPCNCASPGVTIQSVINNPSVVSGDTIAVSGTCIENVDVNKSVIIDGSGIPPSGNPTAEIHGLDPAQPTVKIRTGSVTIKNFHSIQGGQDGIYVSVCGPTILNNTIQNAGRDGVFVFAGTNPTINGNIIQTNTRHGIDVYANSFATIINNDIINNSGDGITITENSAARIGFSSSSDTTASDNTITSNGGNGITLNESSNARIVGNTISNNTGFGIRVLQLSHAQISSNTVDNNGTSNASSGIMVTQDSGVELGSATGSSIFESPNSTTATMNNGGFGINFGTGAYVTGRIGTLNGVFGPIGNTNIGIKTSTLAGDYGIDVMTASDGIIRLGNAAGNNTAKTAGMVLRHYNNAEEPVILFGGASTSASNSLAFGGGSASGNAATQLDFYTAPNPTTPVGTSRMTITGGGNVGIGTSTPTGLLTLVSPQGGNLLQLSTLSPTGGGGFNFSVPTGGSWNFKATQDNGFKIRDATNSKDVLYVQYATGNVGIGTITPAHTLQVCGPGGCSYNDGGTAWINASSREYKDNIETLGADVAIDALKNLNPVTFTYKTMPEQKHVGFVAEEVPDIVAMRDRTGLSTLDIVAVLTKVVQEQRKEMEEQKKEYQKTMSVLSERMDELERALKLKGSLAAIK